MDRNELKAFLRQENSSSLHNLPPDFYRRANKYIHQLEEEIRHLNNPRAAEYKILEDELQSALSDVETIFIRRIRKITTRATSNAFLEVSSREDISKLLPSERKVYEATMSAIQTARKELMEPIFNPNPAPQKERPGEVEDAPSADGTGTGEEDTTQDAAEQAGKRDINEEYCLVRILKDLPTFKAADNHNYTLAAEDIVVLPSVNARGLIKRNAAIPIEGERIRLKGVRL
jgi:DNA replication factor GINS